MYNTIRSYMSRPINVYEVLNIVRNAIYKINNYSCTCVQSTTQWIHKMNVANYHLNTGIYHYPIYACNSPSSGIVTVKVTLNVPIPPLVAAAKLTV